jgi:hypothetical protein
MPFPYSFVDLQVAIIDPFAGAFSFSGEQGAGSFDIEMTTEKVVMQTSADGAIMASFIVGDSGTCHIECQQTSLLHQYFLAAMNGRTAQAKSGSVLNAFGMTVSARSVIDNSTHVLTGVSPTKIPRIPYGPQGQMVTWVLASADIQNS